MRMAFIQAIPLPLCSRKAAICSVRHNPVLARMSAAPTTAVSTPTPVTDRILVRVDEQVKKSESGILLTKQTDKKQMTGTVVAVGPGRFSPEGVRESLDFYKPGDRIIWKDDFGADRFETLSGDAFLAIRAFSVIGKF